jgi:hypothetical protein
MRFCRIRNLEKYQHYKDRRPAWVKLYQTVLEDLAFTCLQDASKAHAILLLLIASRYDNCLPYDANWLGRSIHATEPVDLEALVSAGFIELCDASTTDSKRLARAEQNASPKRIEKREQRTEKERTEKERKTTAKDPGGAGATAGGAGAGRYPKFPDLHRRYLHGAWTRFVGGVDFGFFVKQVATVYPDRPATEPAPEDAPATLEAFRVAIAADHAAWARPFGVYLALRAFARAKQEMAPQFAVNWTIQRFVSDYRRWYALGQATLLEAVA